MTSSPSSLLEGSQDAPLCIDLEEITAEDLLARYTPSPQRKGPPKPLMESPHKDITTASPKRAVRCESLDWETIAAEDDPFGSSPSDGMNPADKQEDLGPQSSFSNCTLRQRSRPNYSLKQRRMANHQGDDLTQSRASRPVPKVVSDMPRSAAVEQGNPKHSALILGSPTKARFILAHRTTFLALLPERNRVLDLLAQANESEGEKQVIAYKEIRQPSG